MASESDFDDLVENPADGSGYALMGGSAPAWPRVVRILKAMKALFRAAGTVVSDRLAEWAVASSGDSVNRRFRIVATGPNDFLVQRNTGTDASPVWSEMFRLNGGGFPYCRVTPSLVAEAGIDVTTGKVTITGGAAGIGLDAGALKVVNVSEIQAALVNVLSELRMNGLPITGAGAITAAGYNGFTLGGSVTPQSVGAANAAGVSTNFARADHAHQGVHQANVDGAGGLTNNINIVSFDRILAQISGQDIRLSWSPRSQSHNNTSGANQTAIAGNTETDVLGLTGISISGANGARNFRLSLHLTCVSTGATQVVVRVYVGATGSMADGAGARVKTVWGYCAGAEQESLSLGEFVFTPAAAAKIGVSIHFISGAVTGTVYRVAPDQAHISLHHV